MTSDMRNRARHLRSEMTPQERHLWYDFLKDYPLHFNRQKVVGNYILDFYCHQARLAIELDGSQHFEEKGKIYDQIRSEYLFRKGITVIRYANNQISNDFRAVCEDIDHTVRLRLQAQI